MYIMHPMPYISIYHATSNAMQRDAHTTKAPPQNPMIHHPSFHS
jgi:hypothetical protein